MADWRRAQRHAIERCESLSTGKRVVVRMRSATGTSPSGRERASWELPRCRGLCMAISRSGEDQDPGSFPAGLDWAAFRLHAIERSAARRDSPSSPIYLCLCQISSSPVYPGPAITETMRPTPQLLRAVGAAVQRQKSISFIGLGRMGSEMAYNLFSQTHVETHGTTRFVVCDAREPTAVAFAQNFTTQFPGAHIEIANTPAE